MKISEYVAETNAAIKRAKPSAALKSLQALTNKMMEVPSFEFGHFDYCHFEGVIEDAILCWNEGLLNFPFEDCVFEHSYSFKGTGLKGSSAYLVSMTSPESVTISEWRFEMTPNGRREIIPPAVCFLVSRIQSLGRSHWGCMYSITPWVPPERVDALQEALAKAHGGEFIDPVMVMALYLNTDGVVAQRMPASKSLNKARIKRGKLPLPDRHIVRIDFSRHQSHRGDGSHASPHPHYRRGHIRRYADGSKTWVRACIVAGSAETASIPRYIIEKSRGTQ